MRSLSTVMTAATASALAALAVTVAVPALGDDGGGGKGDEEATIRACLKDHGATVPDGDGRALKMWIIGPHSGAEEEAIRACGLYDPPPTNHRGPDEAKLRSCLKDHGVTVDDPDLK